MASDTPVIIEQRDDVLGGKPVFGGTRVPVKTLVDYVVAGDRIDDFLEDFPTVSRQQAESFLREAERLVSEGQDARITG